MDVIRKLQGRFTETAIDDEVVVMRLDTGEFFSLVGTSAAIWRLIDGSRNRATIVEELMREFHGEETAMAEELDEFLVRLRDVGLLADA